MSINEEQFNQSLNFLIANALNKALTFGLSDNLGGEVIHLNSSILRTLNLSIANELTEEVLIVGQAGRPTLSNYHFLIQFVSNQCFKSSRLPTLTTPNWSMAVNPGDFITHIYLLSKETITLPPSISKIESSIPTNVQLQYAGAVLKNVADEVLQVAVIVGKHVYAKVDNKDKRVTGGETVHLATFTDAGAPSPLIATLVQPRTVLNDGTTAPLLLRLVNTSPDPVTFASPSEHGGPTPTAVQLSVDIDEKAAWALCKSGEARLIVVAPPPNWKEEPESVSVTGRKTWLFRPDYSPDYSQIAPNSALEFHISGVKTTLPPGLTNLYVTLQEFPNYGTQTAVTQIEKSPLIYNKDHGSGLLSCGATGANPGLTLNGDTTADLLLVNQSGTGKSAHFKGGAGVSIDNNLDVAGDVRINRHTLWLQESIRHGIRFGGDNLFAKEVVGGPIVFGSDGGALGSTWDGEKDNEKIVLSWKCTGNVGIGTNQPKSTLSVKGGAAIGSTYADTVVAPPNSLLVEGNVGIGTNNPVAPLDIEQQKRTGTHPTSLTGLYVTGDFSEDSNGVEFRHSNGMQGIGFGYNTIYATGNVTDQTLSIKSRGSGNLLLLPSQGNVGIGTNQPKSTLSVKGGAAVGSYAETSTAVQNGMIVEGNVGIGNPNPTMAKLQVNGSQTANTNTFAFFAYRQDMKTPFIDLAPGGPISNGIWSDNRIVGVEFNAFSDLRIKDVIGRSDGAQDLATLMRVEVTDYTHKDTATRGQQPQKKVIGQQLLGVYTQAVSLSKDVVPDIYQTAKCLDSWIDLETTLQKGDQVRIIPDNGKESLVDVTEVASNRFRVSPSLSDGAVFVYGRMVNDFASVDYDAIAMLNVSATQQIKREKDAEVQALREENDALRARLDRLENVIKSLVSPGSLLGSDPLEENAPLKLMI